MHGATIRMILIYLLTVIGLTPGGSSTVHIYTQMVHRTTQLSTLVGRLSGIRTQSGQTNWEECGPCPVFASYTRTFALQLRKKNGETSVSIAEECQLTRWKQNVQNRTYMTVRIRNLQKLNKSIQNIQPYIQWLKKTKRMWRNVINKKAI
jgi:hypothetical protein